MYTLCMKIVPLLELKKRLSYWAEKAAEGERIEVTKYNKPFVYISSSEVSALHVGESIGEYSLKSALNDPTRGKWLNLLIEDRGEE